MQVTPAPRFHCPRTICGQRGRCVSDRCFAEDDHARVQLIILEGSEEFVTGDMRVRLCIHTSVDLACVANSLGRHASPNHQTSTSKLDRALNMLRCEPICRYFPHPLAPIRAQTIDISLFGPNDALPVFHSPVLVPQCEFEALTDVFR